MVMGWNWKESDRMESFGSDIEDLDIPSGSLMRHRENKVVEAREEGEKMVRHVMMAGVRTWTSSEFTCQEGELSNTLFCSYFFTD